MDQINEAKRNEPVNEASFLSPRSPTRRKSTKRAGKSRSQVKVFSSQRSRELPIDIQSDKRSCNAVYKAKGALADLSADLGDRLRYSESESMLENSHKLRKPSSNFKGDLLSDYTFDDDSDNPNPFEVN